MSDLVKPSDTSVAAVKGAPSGVCSYFEWSTSLGTIRSGAELLDHLISPKNAAELVAKLPTEDLHLYVHRIGLMDSVELLAMATGAQVRGMLDLEVWIGDTVSVERVDPWLRVLMEAGPEVLGPRLLDLDDELLNWIVRGSVRAYVFEDPEDFTPPEEEHTITPDGRLCVYFPKSEERNLPIKLFIDWLMREDSVLCVDLLLHSTVALDTNLQEAAYRWRSARLADRGYVDYYEALGVYTAPPSRYDPTTAKTDDRQPVTRWLQPVITTEARLAAAFAALPIERQVQMEAQLSYLANTALSADRVEPWDLEGQQETLRRLRAGLVLGLDDLAGHRPDPTADAAVLATHPLSIIFRTGYALTQEAAKPLRKVKRLLASGNEPFGAMDIPKLRDWAIHLAARHPTLADGSPMASHTDLTSAGFIAELVAALSTLASDRPDEIGIGAYLFSWLARDVVGIDGPGPLPIDRTQDVHRALFANGTFHPDARSAAALWFERIGGAMPSALKPLLDEAEDEMAALSLDDLEPRFLRLLWLG